MTIESLTPEDEQTLADLLRRARFQGASGLVDALGSPAAVEVLLEQLEALRTAFAADAEVVTRLGRVITIMRGDGLWLARRAVEILTPEEPEPEPDEGEPEPEDEGGQS